MRVRTWVINALSASHTWNLPSCRGVKTARKRAVVRAIHPCNCARGRQSRGDFRCSALRTHRFDGFSQLVHAGRKVAPAPEEREGLLA